MALPDEFLEELRDRNEIYGVISSYVNLKKAGNLYKGLCPFHNEKTPSFTVYPATQSFYCFGCSAGGEVVTFIRRIENLAYIDAVKFLADRAGMRMPESGYDDSLSKRRARILSANKEAARYFSSAIMAEEGKAALDYLKGRGLSLKTIRTFGLGYAPDSWDALIRHMRTKGFSKEELFEANLVKKSEKGSFYDNFRNRVMTPIIDVRGNVIAFGGRVLDDSKPKYVNTSDTLVYKKTDNVFALNFAKNGNPESMILCEGYMDVITLHQAGFTNAVASLGTALTREQANLISRYTNEVIISYDADKAGQLAAEKAINIFSETGLKIKVLKLEGGKDPDEIIKNYGPERFRAIIEGAANEIEFELIKLKASYDLNTSDGKINFLKEAVELLSECSEIKQDVYSSRLSEELGVSKAAITDEIRRAAARRSKRRDRQEFDKIKRDLTSPKDEINPQRRSNARAVKAEDTLLSAIITNPDFYNKLGDDLNEDLFISDFNRRVFSLVAERIKNFKAIDLTVLSAGFDPQQVSRLAQFFANGRAISNTLKECEDCIKVLKEEKQKQNAAKPEEMTDEQFRALFQKK